MGRMTAAVLLLALAATSPCHATETGDPNRALYLRYCGACHGPEGHGDGIAATFYRTKPTDLTQIMKKNHGKFPFKRTMEIIDGRTTVRAHGDPEMPVWGEVFSEQSGWDMARRADARGKVMLITDYIRSIQQK